MGATNRIIQLLHLLDPTEWLLPIEVIFKPRTRLEDARRLPARKQVEVEALAD